MDRLTYRETDGHALLLYGADAKWRKTEQYGILDAAIQKLAAYEDSKLAPEDIPTALEMCKASMTLNELKRYRDTGLTPEQVRKLKEEPRWIPVTERMPVESKENPVFENKELELYLVSVKNQDYAFRAFWNGKSFTDGWSKLDVIAWMPLPEPYKQEEGYA